MSTDKSYNVRAKAIHAKSILGNRVQYLTPDRVYLEAAVKVDLKSSRNDFPISFRRAPSITKTKPPIAAKGPSNFIRGRIIQRSRISPIREIRGICGIVSTGTSELIGTFVPAKKTYVSRIIRINQLITKRLKSSLDAIIEEDGIGFIIRTIDLPLYSYADDPLEAVENVKFQIEDLYDELMEDDNFTSEWLQYKEFLRNKVI